jgi:hypothetical protein
VESAQERGVGYKWQGCRVGLPKPFGVHTVVTTAPYAGPGVQDLVFALVGCSLASTSSLPSSHSPFLNGNMHCGHLYIGSA